MITITSQILKLQSLNSIFGLKKSILGRFHAEVNAGTLSRYILHLKNINAQFILIHRCYTHDGL